MVVGGEVKRLAVPCALQQTSVSPGRHLHRLPGSLPGVSDFVGLR